MILENLEKIIDFLELGDESSEIEEIKQVVSDPKWPLAILLGWLRNQPNDGYIKPLSFSSEGSWIVELILIVNSVGFLSDSLIFDEASLRFKDGIEYKHFRPLVEDRWHPVVHVSYARDYLRGIAIQWWREMNSSGPILWIPIAYVGHLGGRAALCFLALTLLTGPLQISLSKAERIVCVVVVWIVSWVPGYIADFLKVDPLKMTRFDVCIGWLFVVIAGAFYTATALMGS